MKREERLILQGASLNSGRPLNVTEAAVYLGISDAEVRKLRRLGKLPAQRVAGGKLVFKIEALKALLKPDDMSVKAHMTEFMNRMNRPASGMGRIEFKGGKE